ncbi:protein of unknown function (plasmid) [Caballeronia sp. S22]
MILARAQFTANKVAASLEANRPIDSWICCSPFEWRIATFELNFPLIFVTIGLIKKPL